MSSSRWSDRAHESSTSRPPTASSYSNLPTPPMSVDGPGSSHGLPLPSAPPPSSTYHSYSNVPPTLPLPNPRKRAPSPAPLESLPPLHHQQGQPGQQHGMRGHVLEPVPDRSGPTSAGTFERARDPDAMHVQVQAQAQAHVQAQTQAGQTPQPSPTVKKGRTNTPWTPAEEQLLKVMREAGNSWGEIAKSFPARTEGSVKKHWYKDMHYAEFAEDESTALLAAIKEYEANKWKVIGQKLGKPAKACEQYAKEHFGGNV